MLWLMDKKLFYSVVHFESVCLALIHKWDKSEILIILKYFRISLLHIEVPVNKYSSILISLWYSGLQAYILNVQDIPCFSVHHY